MAETGCVKDVAIQNLEVNGDLNISGFSGRFMDFLVGTKDSIIGATGNTINQAAGVAGETANDFTPAAAYTLTANAESTFSGDGEAATLVNLPPAVKGTLCVLRITGDIDNTGAFTIQTNATTDLFEKQIITIDPGRSITTAGTTQAPTSDELIYTAAAADTNFLGAGSELFFYCRRDNRWLVRVRHIPEGTGATGAFTVN